MGDDIRTADDRDQAMLALEGELQARADEIERLRRLLTEYGRHNEGCSAAHGDRYRCRCGWREVEAQQGGVSADG